MRRVVFFGILGLLLVSSVAQANPNFPIDGDTGGFIPFWYTLEDVVKRYFKVLLP